MSKTRVQTERLPLIWRHDGSAILRWKSRKPRPVPASLLPVENLAARLERALYVYDGPLGLARAFSQMWDSPDHPLPVETAERQVWRILGRKRPFITVETGDRWAMFLGTHIDWIWPERGDVSD